MEESFTIPAEDGGDSELDPRIQIELEKLNAATDEINRLETELDESNTTFRMLLGEASRRLQSLAKRLGSCVERARPYFDALEVAAKARTDCQRAAVQFQRASELHAAAKETVTLAEQRFVSKQDKWQFDSAWQEVLNHAIIKDCGEEPSPQMMKSVVMDAENRKAESGREHQRRALVFSAAERKVTQLEENLKRQVLKSRPYFEEKKLCQEQLNTQKQKIETIQQLIADAKCRYAQSLKTLEVISEEIHRRRGEYLPCKDDGYPVGPREPGVGAEGIPSSSIEDRNFDLTYDLDRNAGLSSSPNLSMSSSPNLSLTSSRDDFENTDDSGLQELRLRVRELALRPIEGRDGESENEAWALELNETINKLDHLLMMKENTQNKKSKFTASSHTEPCDERAHITNHEGSEVKMNYKIEEPSKPVDVSDELQNTLPPSHVPGPHHSPQPVEAHRSMMSLDVVSLVRDTARIEGESFLKAVLEEKSPTGTYTESVSERNDSPDEILMVECEVTDDNIQNPVIRLTNVPVSKSE